MTLNTAEAVYLGNTLADRVYLGSTLVWEAVSWGVEQSMLNPAILPTTNYQGSYTTSVKFRVEANGRITHLRKYNVDTTGTPYLRLYEDATQTLLAEVLVSPVPGWQDIPLDPPVPVVAGHDYMVTSYNQNWNPNYPYQDGVPQSLAPNLSRMRGLYAPADAYPTYDGAQYYWLDVVYQQNLNEAPWTPASIPGCGLWLEADSLYVGDAGPVTSWPDRSGRAHHAVPLAAPPTFKQYGIGGKPSVEFTGSPVTSMRIAGWGTDLAAQPNYTLFQVLMSSNISNWPIITTLPTYAPWVWLTELDPTSGIYWGQPSSAYNLYPGTVTINVPGIYTYALDTSGGAKFYRNGVHMPTSTPGPGGPLRQPIPPGGPDVLLGGYYDGSLGLPGQVAAMIWYDRFLIDSERVVVENYLKAKYGIT